MKMINGNTENKSGRGTNQLVVLKVVTNLPGDFGNLVLRYRQVVCALLSSPGQHHVCPAPSTIVTPA